MMTIFLIGLGAIRFDYGGRIYRFDRYADYLVLYVQTPERAANPQPSMGGARFTLATYADRHADGA